jgi:hypothetical protein
VRWSPWWRRQQAPLKRQLNSTRLHGATTQKTVIFIHAAVRTWNLALKIELNSTTADAGNDLRCSALNPGTTVKSLHPLLDVHGSCTAICWGARKKSSLKWKAEEMVNIPTELLEPCFVLERCRPTSRLFTGVSWIFSVSSPANYARASKICQSIFLPYPSNLSFTIILQNKDLFLFANTVSRLVLRPTQHPT